MPRPHLRAKRWHRKSRSGCKACKERKVKCDERRPVCLKCEVHFENVVECDYGQFDSPSSDHFSGIEGTNVTENSLRQPRQASFGGRDSIPVDIAANIPDPFETYPSTDEPEVHYLLQSFFSSTISKIFPYGSSRKTSPIWEYYAPLINKDHLLFHVALLLSASDIEKAQPPAMRIRCRRLEPLCVQLLQQRINAPVPESVSDETLAAVSGLAAFEHDEGRCSPISIHVNGLRRILDVRGGLGPIRESNETIASIVIWTFLAMDDDLLPKCEYYDAVQRPAWLLEVAEQDRTHPMIDLESLGLGARHAEIMRNIRMLFLRFPSPRTFASASEYQSATTFLTSSLEALVYMSFPQPSTSIEAMLSTACRHALMVYLFSEWIGYHPDPDVMVSIEQSNLLTALRPILKEGISNILLLWMLVVGGAYLEERSEHRWFVGHLEEMCQKMRVQSWAQLKSRLRRVIFSQERDEQKHRQMWAAVAARQGLLP